MKLLLDQNLSRRLLAELSAWIPDSTHVAAIDLDRAGDAEIWAYAKWHGYAILTKDADFLELSLLRGAPPKVVWINCGNISNQALLDLLKSHAEDIREFLESTAEHGVLEIEA